MIVAFEGLSGSGKTENIRKVHEKLRESDYEVVHMKGPGQINVPGEENWKRYNHYMHTILKRLETLNDDLIILGDRIFTEAVQTGNEELLRRYKCYEEKHVIFFDADNETLQKRGTLTGVDQELDEKRQEYKSTLSDFDFVTIDTAEHSTKKTAERVEDMIHDWMEDDDNQGKLSNYSDEVQ